MISLSSLRARASLAALTLGASALLLPAAHAEDVGYPSGSPQHISIRGAVRHVDAATNCLSIVGDDNRNYTIDADSAAIILPDIVRNAQVADLGPGMHIRASGSLVSRSVIEAETVRVVSDVAVKSAALDTPRRARPDRAELDGIVRLVDPDNGRITVADADGRREIVDTFDAAISVGRNREGGQTADLERGMHVVIDGARLSGGRMVADSVRVVRDSDIEITAPIAPPPVIAPLPIEAPPLPRPAVHSDQGLIPPSPDPDYVLAHLDSYTGILIDARHLPDISRSPAPAVYGPEPGESLLYPDRGHVPTPDEVQDESIVRYYHTETEASNGVDGAHPLILPAQAVLGPAKDALQLSADDMTLFNALEKRLHFSRTWKVGFLVSGDK